MSVNLLLLLLMLFTWSSEAQFLGTVMTYSPNLPRTAPVPTRKTIIRYKMNFLSCSQEDTWECSSRNCGTLSPSALNVVDEESSGEWCQKDGYITAQNDVTFKLKLDGGNWSDHLLNGIISYQAVTRMELRRRSDTNFTNWSPLTTILPVLRVPSNCKREFILLAFDRDRDEVKCRYGNPSLSECNPCTPPPGLNLSSSCSLTFNPSSRIIQGPYAVQLMMEDFPMYNITLTGTDPSQTTEITTNDSISKLPVQFVLRVDAEVPSCIEGLYLPKFLPPTPANGAVLIAFVNETLRILIHAEANVSVVSELLFSGPSNADQTTVEPGKFLIEWTPSEGQGFEGHPICFVVQALHNSTKYHSDLRCVVVIVHFDRQPSNLNATTVPHSAQPSTTPETTPTKPGTLAATPQTTPTKPETLPATPQTTPTKPETLPATPQTTPTKPETLAATSGTTPTKPETLPATPGITPTMPETLPATSGTTPTNPETLPATSGITPTKPETLPTTPQTTPTKPETLPATPQTIPTKPVTLPATSGTTPNKPETLMATTHTTPTKPETLPATPGITPTMPETLPATSGTTPTNPETLPATSGITPTKPETLPTAPQTTPTKPETLPATPQTIPTKPVTLPATLQTTSAKPETLPATSGTTPNKPETLMATTHTTPTKPETLPATPQTTPTKPQTLAATPQTTPTKPGTLTATPQTTPTKPETLPATSGTTPAPKQAVLGMTLRLSAASSMSEEEISEALTPTILSFLSSLGIPREVISMSIRKA